MFALLLTVSLFLYRPSASTLLTHAFFKQVGLVKYQMLGKEGTFGVRANEPSCVCCVTGEEAQQRLLP